MDRTTDVKVESKCPAWCTDHYETEHVAPLFEVKGLRTSDVCFGVDESQDTIHAAVAICAGVTDENVPWVEVACRHGLVESPSIRLGTAEAEHLGLLLIKQAEMVRRHVEDHQFLRAQAEDVRHIAEALSVPTEQTDDDGLAVGPEFDLGGALPSILAAVFQGIDAIPGYYVTRLDVEGFTAWGGRLQVQPPTKTESAWSWRVIAEGRGEPKHQFAEVETTIGGVELIGMAKVRAMCSAPDGRAVLNIEGTTPLVTKNGGHIWKPWMA